MSLMALLILAFDVVVEGLPSLGTTQSAAVRGVLMCNGKPSVGTKVKLYDVDSKLMVLRKMKGRRRGDGFRVLLKQQAQPSQQFHFLWLEPHGAKFSEVQVFPLVCNTYVLFLPLLLVLNRY